MGDAAGIYTEAELEAFILAYLADKHGAMSAPSRPPRTASTPATSQPSPRTDKMLLEQLDLFRKDVGSFFRPYDFLSQIIDYGDTDSKMTDIYLTQRDDQGTAHQAAGRVRAQEPSAEAG